MTTNDSQHPRYFLSQSVSAEMIQKKPFADNKHHKLNNFRYLISNFKFSHWALLIYPIFLFFIRRRRLLDEVYIVDTSAIYQIVFTGLLGFYSFIRILKWKKYYFKALFSRPLIWLVLYGLLAIISSLWSSRVDYTLFRSFQFVIFLILVFDAMVLFDHFEDRIKYYFLFSITIVIFWHFSHLLYYSHNSLITGTVIGLFFLGWSVKGTLWRLLYIIIIFSIIIGTSTATYISLLAGLASCVIFLRMKTFFRALFLLIIVILIALWAEYDFVQLVLWGKSKHNILTASGRVPVWKWVYKMTLKQRPLLGFGFGVGETLARIREVGPHGLRMIHMHNSFLSALTNLGFVGLGVIISFFFDIFNSIFKLCVYLYVRCGFDALNEYRCNIGGYLPFTCGIYNLINLVYRAF